MSAARPAQLRKCTWTADKQHRPWTAPPRAQSSRRCSAGTVPGGGHTSNSNSNSSKRCVGPRTAFNSAHNTRDHARQQAARGPRGHGAGCTHCGNQPRRPGLHKGGKGGRGGGGGEGTDLELKVSGAACRGHHSSQGRRDFPSQVVAGHHTVSAMDNGSGHRITGTRDNRPLKRCSARHKAASQDPPMSSVGTGNPVRGTLTTNTLENAHARTCTHTHAHTNEHTRPHPI